MQRPRPPSSRGGLGHVSALATAAGTLVLALATSLQCGRRTGRARVAERGCSSACGRGLRGRPGAGRSPSTRRARAPSRSASLTAAVTTSASSSGSSGSIAFGSISIFTISPPGGRRHLDHAAARARGHRSRRPPPPAARCELLLHLHRLLGELLEVHRLMATRAPRVEGASSSARRSPPRSPAAPAHAPPAPRCSPVANTSASRRPVTS